MKKNLSIVVVYVLVVMFLVYNWYQSNEHIRFVNNMGAGINVGNSLDCTHVLQYHPDADVVTFETAWGNPQITPELFEELKNAGFGVVRIPVSWEEHIDLEGTIEPVWLERVEEVVRQGIDAGLYVILNTHHESFIIPTIEAEETTTKLLVRIWEQVAERFRDVDQKLLFECMNEPRLQGSELEWTSGDATMQGVINRINQAFVDTVRQAGGKNLTRYLLLEPYAADAKASEAMVLPEDDYLIVSIHSYAPYEFTQKKDGTSEWSSDRTEDTKQMHEVVDILKTNFVDQGIPVIVTEFGCINRGNLSQRLDWTEYYTSLFVEHNINYIWWDNGIDEYGLLHRQDLEWTYPEIADILTRE